MAKQEWSDEDYAMYHQFYEEFAAAPLDYVRHDANARTDVALRTGVIEHGLEFAGRWWTMVECLCSKRGHLYDVTTDTGWMQLALDLSTSGHMWSIDECREFCEQLVGYGLISPESWSIGHVVNERVVRECDKYARAAAGKKLGSWKTNQAKLKSAGA